MTVTTLAPDILTRLERLAPVRDVETDSLVSDAILAYLARAEIELRKDEIDRAYTDDPHDEDAAREEKELAAVRRHFLRKSLREEVY